MYFSFFLSLSFSLSFVHLLSPSFLSFFFFLFFSILPSLILRIFSFTVNYRHGLVAVWLCLAAAVSSRRSSDTVDGATRFKNNEIPPSNIDTHTSGLERMVVFADRPLIHMTIIIT